MESSITNPAFAWQPLTPRGVAAFATASLGRLLVVQLVVALLSSAAVVWFLHAAWFPIIGEAVSQLPAAGEIRSGTLAWTGVSPASLAEGQVLALTVDLKHEGRARSPAHIQVEFGEKDCEVFSLLGFVKGPYPPEWVVAFNRDGLVPWWGAWEPALLGITVVLVVSALMLVWATLATVYALPVWLLGFFANRQLTLPGSWRLSGAALLPGALVFSAAIVLYGVGAFGLIELAAAAAAHVLVGWIYLISSPLRLPVHPAVAAAKANPFSAPVAEPASKPEESKEPEPEPPRSEG